MDKKWQDMTAEEKRNARFQEWLNAEGVEFQNPEAEANYKAAVNRFMDAVTLRKVPDRVPTALMSTFMPTQIYGVSAKDCMYDYEKMTATHLKFMDEFKPDYYGSPAFIGSGKVYELLDTKFYAWSGGGLDDNLGYQFVEAEYMKPNEYDALIEDPTDFWLRSYMPRIFGALAPLTNLPTLTSFWEIVGVSGTVIPFGIPDVQKALKALMAAGDEAMTWIQHIVGFEMKVRGMGYPTFIGGAAKAPFDMIGDTLRGTKGIMMDMFRQPAKLVKAMEHITPLYIKQAVGMATQAKNPMVFIPLHKGADGFMSDDQFKKYYWPTLKALILGLAEEGCIPFLFCEGGYNSRLEYLKELPKGSCFWFFDRTDMKEVKKAVGGNLCIGGNVPAGLILTGTPDQVKDYCKGLIDDIAPGGGYIMAFGTAMDEGKADTIHAMIDFTKEYGVYK